MNYEAFFKISYGLYIISAKSDQKVNGYIGNTAFQVTANPAQIAISCNKDNFTAGLIEKSKTFSISILKQDAASELIGTFGYKSGKDINKFESIPYITGKSGAPIVEQDCVAWFDCKVTKQVEVDTHILFIAEIIDNKLLEEDGQPLTYAHYRDVKKGVAPKNAPTYIDKSKVNKEKSTTTGSEKYKCLACGYIYDPEIGDPDSNIAPGTSFEDLPEDWLCPTCGSPKEMFEKI